MRRAKGLATAFAVFGLFWGGWAACLPAVQRATDASASTLGIALLAVALGALPAMLAAGRLADTLGQRIVPLALVAFGLTTMLPADASRRETVFRVRVMDGLHAAFSAGVLVGAAGTGFLRKAGAHPSWILFGIGALVILSAAANVESIPSTAAAREPRRIRPARGLLVVGAVLALAFVVESGVEQWSALFLERTFDSSPAVSGLGPGLFAASMATGRLLAQRFARPSVTARMVFAGTAASAGAGLAAASPHAAVALIGFVIAGIGLALSAPTLFGVAGRVGGEAGRGAAVSTVAILGYVGFLAGPPLIGAVSGGTSLRGGFIFLCVTGLLVAASTPALRGPAREIRR